MDDETRVYEVYCFDCPCCGGRTELGDCQPDQGETVNCDDCGMTLTVAG